MKAQKTHSPAVRSAFYLMFGAMVFSLSSFSGSQSGRHQKVAQRSLSSEVAEVSEEFGQTDAPAGCDLHTGLNQADTASCKPARQDLLIGKKTFSLKGEISVEIKDVQERASDGLSFVKVKRMVVVTRILSPYNGKSWISNTQNYDPKKVTQIDELAEAQYASLASSVSVRIRKIEKTKLEKELLAEDVLNCVRSSDGKDMAKEDRPACFVDQLGTIKDEKKAAQYYEKNLRKDIQDGLNSPDLSKRVAAVKMLQALKDAGIKNQFINESMEDLANFALYKNQLDQAAVQIAGIQDPRQRAEAYRQLALKKGEADQYFTQRGIQVQNQPYNYGGLLTSDLTGYNALIAQDYAALIESHNRQVNQNAFSNLSTNSQNGTVSLDTQGNRVIPQLGTPVRTNPANSFAPISGSPVRIR